MRAVLSVHSGSYDAAQMHIDDARRLLDSEFTALVGESYKLWIEREDRTDDITIIVGFIEQAGAKRDPGVGVEEVAIEEGTAEMKKKKTRRGSLGGKAQ